MLLKLTDRTKRILSIVLALATLFSVMSISVYALTESEKDAYEEKIDDIQKQIKENEKKIDELKKEAASYDNEIDSLEEKIDVLQSQIDLYDEKIALIDADIADIDSEIAGIENEIDSLNKQIEELNKRVEEIELQIADTYDLLGERIRASYMSGVNSELEYLLTSDSFEFQSYLERIELLERIAEHDDILIKDLEEDITELQAKVLEIEDMKVILDEKITELDKVKAEYEAKKKEQVDARQVIKDAEDEILADLDKIMSYVNSLDKESAAYEAAIERGESEILEYEQKLSQQNTSYGSGVVSGDMIWPLPYSNTYVSSSFKMRTLNGTTKMHNGLDISRWGGSAGLNIIAAKEGTVEVAYHSGYNGGYGLYVVVNHGNGVKTYYAHMSKTLVNVGDYVTQGTVLGLVGNTGRSYGAHLHFGVMVNGAWKNPMNYVSKPAGLQITG